MVKFSFITLAAAVATASASSAVSKKTIKLGNRQLRRGEASTEALLKKAVPYKGKKAHAKKNAAAKRRLDGEEEEFEIDGTYSLQFSECVDVTTYDEDLFDEDLVSYVQAGQIVAAKSYVLFHVCQDDTCYLEGEDDLYMVDLATYLTNVAQYHANKRTDFCDQCDRFEDYCNPEEEEEEEVEEEEAEEEEEEGESEDGEEEEGEQEEGEEDEEGEDRKKRKLTRKGNKKLSKKAIQRALANNDKEYINCNQCQAYECYVDEENMDDGYVAQEELDNSVSEWIEGLSECQETGVQWNNLDLYVGAMCSPYGDGVELAVFANDECTWYTNQKSFNDVYSYANDENNDYSINYLTYAENYIKSAFSEVLPCAEKEYDDPEEEENDDQNEDEEERYEVNDYCQGVMEEETVSFANCQADEDAEEEEEEEDENAQYYNWFTYDMKEADDINEVCVALNAKDHAEYSHIYDEETSGTWYKRNKKGAIVREGEEKEGLSGGAIFGIILVALGVVGGAGFMAMKSKKAKAVETEYQGGAMS